jgi:hypothetical protein
MKQLKLLFVALLLGGSLGLAAQAPGLIFTEWAWGRDPLSHYMELTNMEDTAINLSAFSITHYLDAHIIPDGTSNPANKKDFTIHFKDYFIGDEAMLGPGKSILIVPTSEKVNAYDGFTTNREPLLEIADIVVYIFDGGVPAEEDSTDHKHFFADPNGDECKYLWYKDSNGDSITVDAINNNVDPLTNKVVRWETTSIAGVDNANRYHVLVRKANITTGNTNWDLARGTSLIDSEWLPIPYDWFNNNWNPSLFTTIGSHGDYSIDFDSETLSIDHDNKTITVPWGCRKGTFGVEGTHSKGLIEEIAFGPGMSYWYNEVADSSSSACQTGDELVVYACGNDLEKETYSIIVKAAANDNALALPKRVYSVIESSWVRGETTMYPSYFAELYTVSEGVPGMDTISRIAFAERIDTLLAYMEIAPEASAELVFFDGEDRVDLKEGDILKIIAKNGSTKDYYLALDDLAESANSQLASITWPELPFELDGWDGYTIPGFAPGVLKYNLIVPYGINSIPALAVSVQDVNANVKMERATALGGGLEERTTNINFTSQDSSQVQVYRVIFYEERLEDDLQPYKAEPIMSEISKPFNDMSNFVEIANVGNQDIDLSEYLFVLSNSANPANAIRARSTADSAQSYDRRNCKYIPGYKYGTYPEWAAKPGAVKLDPDLDPILKAGDCFVLASLIAPLMDETAPYYCDPSKYDMHWSQAPYENIHGDVANKVGHAFPIWANRWTLYIFKINPNSAAAIYDGSKGITDPGDFTLIDRFGGEVNVVWEVAGQRVTGGSGLYRKPGYTSPNLVAKGGFGTNADDSDWINNKWQQNPDPISNGAKIGALMADLGNFTHDPITAYMSFVNSTTYLVDAGYEGALGIKGILPNSSTTTFESEIIKMDDDQVLKVLSASTVGDTLEADDIIAQGDTLLVVSADGTRMTKYMLNIGALDDDAVLIAKDGSGYTVDITGKTATITGVAFETTLESILSKLEKPGLAVLNVLDADQNLLPLKVENLADSIYKATMFTGGVSLEVVAQDQSKITYELIANVASGEAWLSSNSYVVNQSNKVIYGVPEGTSAEIFMSMIYAAGGASMELLDKAGYSRETGYIKDDIVRVTSEDASNVVDYAMRFIGYTESSEAYVTSDLYDVNNDAQSIGSIPASTGVSVFLGNVVPVAGAVMELKDAAGAAKESGMILTGDVLTVTSEDSSIAVSYTVDVLVSAERKVFENVTVYPNPVNNILNISGLKKQTRVELISITGQVLRSNLTSDDTYVMDMSSQKSGYYFLRVSDSDQNTRLFRIICTKQ